MYVGRRITPVGMFRHRVPGNTSCRSRHSQTLASACGTTSSTSVNAPSARCAVTATAPPSVVGTPGGSGSIIVKHRPRMRVGSTQRVGLALPSRTTSGRGDGTMRYTAAGNPIVSERRGRGRRERIAGRDRTGGGDVRLQPRRVTAVDPRRGRTHRCLGVRFKRAAPGRRAATRPVDCHRVRRGRPGDPGRCRSR